MAMTYLSFGFHGTQTAPFSAIAISPFMMAVSISFCFSFGIDFLLHPANVP